MARISMVTMDTTDAEKLATWWATQLGGEVVGNADGWFCSVQVPDMQFLLGFQKVDNPTPGKNRLHLDLDPTPGIPREQLISDWVMAGATHLGHRGEMGFAWDTFTDPDGNEFCIGDPA